PAPGKPAFKQEPEAEIKTAKSELQKATPNKGGHRIKALQLVNQAIAQANAGIAYARQHNHATSSAAPDQPHMTAALAALESAKNNLDHATNDKGGHRAQAIDLIKQAIDEVNKGIEAGKS